MGALKKILPVIGLALFAYLLVRIGIKDILSIIAKANFFYIILTILFIIPIVFFQAAKWNAILKKQKIRLKFGDVVKVQLISIFYGTVTPARVGSFIKIAYLQEKIKNFGKATSSVVIDRAFDMLTVLIFAGIGTLILINQFPRMVIFIFSVLAASLIFLMLIISKKNGQRIMRFFYERLLPQNIKKKTRDGFNEFYSSIPKKRHLIVPFILNIITWMAIYTQVFFVAKAINMQISYFIIIFMVPIATIIAEIPISVGGLGLREASLIGLLGVFSVPAKTVMSMSIISLILGNLIPAILGLILAARGYNLKDIQKINKNAKIHNLKKG